MKFFLVIMSFTIFVCSVIPCREVVLNQTGHDQSPVVKTPVQSEHNDQDNCSPFCSCNCCCSITFLYSAYQVTKPVEIILPKTIVHLSPRISDTSLPVWQPPQLV